VPKLNPDYDTNTTAGVHNNVFKISKLAIRTTFEPRLYYLDIILDKSKANFPTQALIDTGCAKSAMSYLTFEKLHKLNSNLRISNSKAKIETCDGTSHPIIGFVTIDISFMKGDFNLQNQQIMVIKQLSDSFLLGSDILGSSYVSKIQHPEIHFTDGSTNFVETMRIKRFPQLQMKTLRELQISPNKSFPLVTEIIGYKQLIQPIEITSCIPQLQIKSVNLEDNCITTTLVNDSKNKLKISTDTPLINLNKSTFETSLPNDEYMSNEEKFKALETFQQDGIFQPSITSFIESRSAITEADKIEIPGEISDEQFIAMFDLQHFGPDDRQMLENILFETRNAFSMHKYDIGKTSLVTMDIELIKEEEDKVQKYTPIAMNVIEKANEILAQMEKYDIIRECHVPSPYCSNILVIPKKDVSQVRLLFDGRLLNYNTKRMPVAIITKAEILAHLVNKTHLTSLDFADAFFHIPLTEKAQNLTAFWTPNHAKKMCFNRAPQGLRNSPMYLKMLLDHVFYDLSENVLFYADDLLVATNGTLKEHFEFLKVVLIRLIKAGLKLRPQKLLIARETINFLGMVFYKNTLSIPDLKLKAFKELPVPNTAKRLKSALCAFSYYRHFVPNFAHITRELHEKSSSKTKAFKMTDEDIKQFKDIVDTICKSAVTYYPVADRPFYVQTDASMYCAGGRLFQKNDNGEEMLIAAVSRTFTKTERNYTIYKKEALALLYTLRSMDFFLKFAPKLILLVDSKALTYIRLAKEGAPILLRFSLELSKYDAELIHVPGEQNEISDLLSRQHKDIPEIELEKLDRPTITEKDTIKIIEALTMPNDFQLTKSQLFSLLNGPSPIDDNKNRKVTKSKALPGPKQVKNTPITLHKRKIKMPRTLRINALTRSMTRKQVEFNDKPVVIPENIADKNNKPITNSPPNEQIHENTNENSQNDSLDYSDVGTALKVIKNDQITPQQFQELQLIDDQIQKAITSKSPSIVIINDLAYKLEDDKKKLLLPKSLLPVLINLNHFVNPGIHKSSSQIARDIRAIYSISNALLARTIATQLKDCHICQLFQDGKQNLRILQLPRHGMTRMSWSIDLITDLPCSKNNNKILLIAVDDFANYVIAIPIPSASSADMIKAIREHIINPFGIPKFIRSDEQPGFYNSKEFFAFFQSLGIELQATAVASPFSNGRAETTIKIFKHAARKYFFQQNCISQWDEHAPLIAAAINSSINSYGYAPEEIMFGHRLEDRVALTDIFSEDQQVSAEQTASNLINRAITIREKYNLKKLNKEKANATFKNKEAGEKKFEVGQLVLHRQLQVSTGTASKYKPLLTGPYVIQAIDRVTATCLNLQSSRIIKAHFHNLVPYRYDERTVYPPEGAQIAPTQV